MQLSSFVRVLLKWHDISSKQSLASRINGWHVSSAVKPACKDLLWALIDLPAFKIMRLDDSVGQ